MGKCCDQLFDVNEYASGNIDIITDVDFDYHKFISHVNHDKLIVNRFASSGISVALDHRSVLGVAVDDKSETQRVMSDKLSEKNIGDDKVESKYIGGDKIY